MKKRIIIICVLLVLVVVTCFYFCNNIKPRRYIEVSPSIYYSKLLNKEKYIDYKEAVLKYGSVISDYINKDPYLSKYNYYVMNYNYDTLDNSHTFNVYQLLDGNIVVPGNIITISINDGKVKNCLYDFELLDDVKLDYKIGVRKAIRIARGVARGNKDSMLVNPFGMKGEAYLEYYFGSLYYKVIINDYSYVCVDANTGEVLDSFFHDGVVY